MCVLSPVDQCGCSRYMPLDVGTLGGAAKNFERTLVCFLHHGLGSIKYCFACVSLGGPTAIYQSPVDDSVLVLSLEPDGSMRRVIHKGSFEGSQKSH